MGRGLVEPDNNNFAPRIGLSWSPTGRWTVRTGFGVFFVQDSGNPVFDMARNLAGRDLFITSLEQRNAVLEDPWALERQRFTCTGYSGTCLGQPQILGNVQNMRTPYIEQWMFNIQRAADERSCARDRISRQRGPQAAALPNIQSACPEERTERFRSVNDRTPWPAYGRLQEVDGVDNSNYHALSTKLTQRFSHGLTYMASFTWAKAIDGGSAIRTNSGDTLWPVNSYDLGPNEGCRSSTFAAASSLRSYTSFHSVQIRRSPPVVCLAQSLVDGSSAGSLRSRTALQSISPAGRYCGPEHARESAGCNWYQSDPRTTGPLSNFGILLR